MQQADRDKIHDAIDYSWGSLKNRIGDYPPRIAALEHRIVLWLDGETIQYQEFGFDLIADYRAAQTAEESTTLWAFILTDRFALRITIPKQPDTKAVGDVEWELVLRSSLYDLRFDMVTVSGFRLMTIGAEFAGIQNTVQIPSKPDDMRINEGRRRELFLSLREDLFA